MLVKDILKTLNTLDRKIEQYENSLVASAKLQNLEQVKVYNDYLENALKLKEELINFDLDKYTEESFWMYLMQIENKA